MTEQIDVINGFVRGTDSDEWTEMFESIRDVRNRRAWASDDTHSGRFMDEKLSEEEAELDDQMREIAVNL